MNAHVAPLALIAAGLVAAAATGCEKESQDGEYEHEPPPREAYSVDEYRSLCDEKPAPFPAGRR